MFTSDNASAKWVVVVILPTTHQKMNIWWLIIGFKTTFDVYKLPHISILLIIFISSILHVLKHNISCVTCTRYYVLSDYTSENIYTFWPLSLFLFSKYVKNMFNNCKYNAIYFIVQKCISIWFFRWIVNK